MKKYYFISYATQQHTEYTTFNYNVIEQHPLLWIYGMNVIEQSQKLGTKTSLINFVEISEEVYKHLP